MTFLSPKLWPLLAGACLVASPAWGADSGSGASDSAEAQPTLEQARVAFLEGRDLMKEEKWGEAAAKFAYAARAKNTPGLRYHVGLCLENDGQLVNALHQYREAEELLRTERAADVAALVKEAIPRVEQEMPRLVIKGIPHGAYLHIDGRAESLFDEHYPLDPGKHQVTIKAEGFLDYATEVSLKRASTEILEVQMSLPPEATASPEELAPPPDESPANVPRRVVLWSSVSVGVIGLGVGITGTVLRARYQSDVEYYGNIIDTESSADSSACVMPDAPLGVICDELSNSLSRKSTAQGLMIAGYSAAAVGAIGAALTYFLWPETNQEVAGLKLQNLRPTAQLGRHGDWQLGLATEF